MMIQMTICKLILILYLIIKTMNNLNKYILKKIYQKIYKIKQ